MTAATYWQSALGVCGSIHSTTTSGMGSPPGRQSFHLSPTAAYMWLWHVACGSKYVHSTTSGPPLLGAHLSPTATNCLPLAPSSPCPGATCPAQGSILQ